MSAPLSESPGCLEGVVKLRVEVSGRPISSFPRRREPRHAGSIRPGERLRRNKGALDDTPYRVGKYRSIS